ncbi:DUF2272 domain-containing protein [Hoeflea poritis]|uniref:DUF2272 domain-containing protein n=1 Tax=Hoeflea poritis TaxID=2993659 RepID=A0ABT4VUM0_9HYPH|nr:DUF2272 domain-containing protein [Hoeflea poritis]MDA4848396.1 DUF2272 domain-containing protein [Hoeflea poritis]
MPVSELDQRTARVAVTEWWAWGGQFVDGESSSLPKKKISNGPGAAGLETKSGYKQRVYTYFKMGVYPSSNGWKKNKQDPWSAAFISYCLRLGGAGSSFPYSVGHHRYVSEAARNTMAGNSQNTIAAYDSADIAPSVGDLLWRGRKPKKGLDTSKWDLQDIIKHVKAGKGGFPSHCDLVVSIDDDAGHVYSIGGNVSNRVLRMRSQIDEYGILTNTRYRVIIRNNITETAGV